MSSVNVNVNVNVLSLKSKGRSSLAEKSGEVHLKTNDPISALQAIAKHAKIKINLNQAEIKRLTSAGRFKISLSYANNFSGATDAIKKIDQLASEAIAANAQASQKKRALWKNIGLLILAILIGAALFTITVITLDIANGTNVKLPFLH